MQLLPCCIATLFQSLHNDCVGTCMQLSGAPLHDYALSLHLKSMLACTAIWQQHMAATCASLIR